MRLRIISNGCGDIIVAAEIVRRGRKDYIPAENWRELEPAAVAELETRGVKITETGIFDCPRQLAERAKFGFELFWAVSDLSLGIALAKWRREVLGVNDYASFATQHGASPRTVLLLEQRNQVPRRDNVRSRLEQAYRLPQGFFKSVEAERSEVE